MRDNIVIAAVVAVIVVVSYAVISYPVTSYEHSYVPKCPTNKVQTFT